MTRFYRLLLAVALVSLLPLLGVRLTLTQAQDTARRESPRQNRSESDGDQVKRDFFLGGNDTEASDSVSVQPSSPPAETPLTELDGRVAAFCTKVLADPSDTLATKLLLDLRRRQEIQHKESLAALATGLQAWLVGQRDQARAEFEKVNRCAAVRKMAEMELGMSMDELRAQLSRQSRDTRSCPQCGGTGLADCQQCNGIGEVICAACGGTGKQETGRSSSRPRLSSSSSTVCPACNGTGTVKCAQCDGKGVVSCSCDPALRVETRKEATSLPNDMAENITRLITKVAYLRDGGFDLFSPQALRCSPKASTAATSNNTP